MDLNDLAKQLYMMADDLHAGLADGLQITATKTASNAKKRLGKYQQGWAKLKEVTIRRKFGKNKAASKTRMKRGGSGSDSPLVDTGIMRASITNKVDRGSLQAEVGTPAIQAATHEFGDEARGIPARPYLRPALHEEMEHIEDNLAAGIAKRVSSK
ncbi:hypothetical protein CIG75_12775 [Tumebacillus algifaecis]|uniref:Phage virion morphogenesis protein n=1 Tax=Tumebacillus algifaecis TaxID=1214604 RepID=A0A223D2X9_9BACL|nr:phage virion morphogenesis protein [Tumebacillus algifaecis]ASS75773.1 hypothetical protein CIG75_12775 [Tumebacillus algifaecis]